MNTIYVGAHSILSYVYSLLCSVNDISMTTRRRHIFTRIDSIGWFQIFQRRCLLQGYLAVHTFSFVDLYLGFSLQVFFLFRLAREGRK